MNFIKIILFHISLLNTDNTLRTLPAIPSPQSAENAENAIGKELYQILEKKLSLQSIETIGYEIHRI